MVDRCICKRLTFKYLLKASRSMTPPGAETVSIHALADQTGVGQGCGMCVPYALVALKTNNARVPLLSVEEFERILGKPVPRCLADVPPQPGDPTPLMRAM
jgi:bacterioferritin-associated ferredoxin